MRVLLLHPEDSPRYGPWSQQRWDLVVDLGKSSRFSEQEWSEKCECPILRADVFREGIADARRVREILSVGRGRLVDEEGVDWWDLNLRFVPEALSTLTLIRVAAQLSGQAELWATRAGWRVSVVGALCKLPVRSFGSGRVAQSMGRVGHYAGVFRRFLPAQIKEIVLDKYDSGYRWRGRFAPKPGRCAEPVVLLPSAYVNVSRMASAYARLLPEQSFLLIAARQSARQFVPPANVQVRDLAAYASGDFPEGEADSLLARWTKLKTDLRESTELQLLMRAGIFELFPGWLRDGLGARNAWREVLEREPVCGVLCGDDSNMTTRIPVVLAAKRGIATADFHHGAFDGRYLLKDLISDVYLTKNEMERDYLSRVCGLPAARLTIAAPKPSCAPSPGEPKKQDGAAAVFFSEPYELAEMRAEEVYRELLPALVRLTRENGRSLIIKLHPFESRAQRARIVRDVLGEKNAEAVTLVDGPLTPTLMTHAWFGITVESTAVMDCLENGVRCFLCAWLTHSPYGYLEQYVRFGVGEVVHDLREVGEIPARLAGLSPTRPPVRLSEAVDASVLKRWLSSKSQDTTGARSVS